MGNEVTISEGLVVTLVSMLVVFAVLLLISFLIGLLKSFSEGKKKDVPIETKATIVESTPSDDVVVEENNEELVAVVAAALAASLGLDIPDINIQSIRRIPQHSIPWAEMGKKEQLLGKL